MRASVIGARGAMFAGFGAIPTAAMAQEGHAAPGQMGLLAPATDVAVNIDWFHNDILMPIIVAICLFVAGLLIYCMVRFNEKAHPVPSRTTHSTVLEVAWTLVPVLILVIIAIPSFRLLTYELVLPPADIAVKVTGKQWYWSYEYAKDQGDFGFDSFMKAEKDLKAGDLRQLAVDNEVVLPVGKVVRLQITSADVIHSFVIQPFGVRMDAVPGRLNETWFKAEREGVYYGQCSKLCGKDHAYMPIAFRIVSADAYQAWISDAKKKFAANPAQSDFAAVTAPVPRAAVASLAANAAAPSTIIER